MVNTSRQIGGAIGIALLISIATSLTSGQIGANRPIPYSLTYGFRIAYLIMVGLVLLAAAIAFFGLQPPGGGGRRGWRRASCTGSAAAKQAAPTAPAAAPAAVECAGSPCCAQRHRLRPRRS